MIEQVGSHEEGEEAIKCARVVESWSSKKSKYTPVSIEKEKLKH